MSLIDTDAVWLALGDFYELFPEDERPYWDTFWESFSDIIADLWGYAFQVDRNKSLFSATATFERREVLVKFSEFTQGISATFRISSLKQDSSGRWVLRGFVPRNKRTFKAVDLEDTGLIRMGIDLIPYLSANSTTIVGGVYDGFVRETSFILDDAPPHDYGDDPDFNDDFAQDPLILSLRVAHPAGDLLVDAVGSGTVIPSGLLQLQGETVEYDAVTIVADRYVFQLMSALVFAHAQDQEAVVQRHDAGRWIQRQTGAGRMVCNGQATLVIESAPSTMELLGQYTLKVNVDFDVAVVVSPQTWDDPVPVPSSKSMFARIRIGLNTYDIGIISRHTSTGFEHAAFANGNELAITEAVEFEARFKRVGGNLELQFRDLSSDSYQILWQGAVTGNRTTIDLVIDDPDSDSLSRVDFDEVIRRAGELVGQSRLEEFFAATALYPYAYAIDQNLTSAPALIDRPRVREELLRTTVELVGGETIIKAQGHGEDFEALGVPDAGTLTLLGTTMVYDQLTRDGDVFEFHVRKIIDPSIVPVVADTNIIASTRELTETVDYELTGDGGISLKELPTRDRMWAPVAQIDKQHIQEHFGKLVDLQADVSTPQYLSRVQGTWFSLMSGAAYQNVHTGLQLAMGLPVATVSGTVTTRADTFDNLGRRIKRILTILNEDGMFEYELDPELYPDIDWTVDVGQTVDRFQALTNGVQVYDVQSDPLWHERFPGVSELERFNSFGIFVALEALSADASVDDAVRFALRIKPTYTKMIMRFLLTSGDEDLSDDLSDDLLVAQVPHLCEDVTFPEGDAPEGWDAPLTLGVGHKLGQGKQLGGTGQWHPATLGTYRRQGPFEGGVGAADVFTATGAYLDAENFTADGSTVADGSIFTTSGAYTFLAADVGKNLGILDGDDTDTHAITELISPTSVRLDTVMTATASGLDWRLRTPKFVATDLAKNVHIKEGADEGDHKIIEVDAAGEWVRVLYTFVNTESVDWELRDYRKLGEDWTLGELKAYRCRVPADHEPHELVTSEQIVTVAVSP